MNTYMSKYKLTLSVDKELVEKAKELNISISTFLEIRLRDYMALIQESNGNSAVQRTCRDLNPSQRLRRPL